ncbi:MAG: hypothetical protein AABZ53_06705 [Planctomycetota bacterium]
MLFDSDIARSDEHVRETIQNARTDWTRRGFRGERSGFVVTVVSRSVINARPGPALKAFAQRLCGLYLLDEIACDQVYMDDLFLEAPGHTGQVWRWRAGVNYFAANGDGRWWQDHRMPGGIAFSVNSVGHMARSGAINRLLADGATVLGLNPADLPAAPIDSLDKALMVAMQTISGASNATSGKATWLREVSSEAPPARRCPAHFPPKLQPFDACEYGGFYHTDFTVPSDYFEDSAVRPAHVRQRTLDFTYLRDAGVDNPAHITMGVGQRIKGEPDDGWTAGHKRQQSAGELVAMSDSARLMSAIGSN